VKKEKRLSAMTNGKMELKLPPVEAFSFKGIMDEIRHGVADDLERIAEICARSKYSLSNQYEVHMPPHGRGEPILQRVGLGVSSHTHGGGPTLQAIGSDDEQARHVGRGSRGGRRTKSVAYGTLETIMSSSRSSEEDKSKKKSAAVLAEEVRGRAAKELQASKSENNVTSGAVEDGNAEQMPSKHVRSRSATLVSMIIDNAQGFKNDGSPNSIPSTSLISEPARPQTSTAMDLETMPTFDETERERSPTLYSFMSPRLGMLRHESMSSTLRPEPEPRQSMFGGLGSWLPWARSAQGESSFQGRTRSASHAEGSLRELLKSTDFDRKGKGVDRTG
jgi:hypothetical protein